MTFRAGEQLATGHPVSNGMFNCELRLGFFMTLKLIFKLKYSSFSVV